MLATSARLRRAADFRSTVRRGIRVGRPTLVLHAWCDPDRPGVRVGFVVAKTVGGAVQRNRVKRRLRHLAAAQLSSTPAGTDVVVRALPAAATTPEQLAPDLVSAWSRAAARLAERS